jgi:hypothetical protein
LFILGRNFSLLKLQQRKAELGVCLLRHLANIVQLLREYPLDKVLLQSHLQNTGTRQPRGECWADLGGYSAEFLLAKGVLQVAGRDKGSTLTIQCDCEPRIASKPEEQE